MPSFEYNAEHFLLTYSQCGDLDEWAVLDKISSLGGECIIGRESHANGGTHLHAFVKFERKFRSRRADIFDVDGCHPNINRSWGNPEGGFDYATKDGDVVAGGLGRDDLGGNTSEPSQDIWHQAVAQPSRDEFFALLEVHVPKYLILHFPAISKWADFRYRTEAIDYISPEGTFNLDDYRQLHIWVEESLGGTYSGT